MAEDENNCERVLEHYGQMWTDVCSRRVMSFACFFVSSMWAVNFSMINYKNCYIDIKCISYN